MSCCYLLGFALSEVHNEIGGSYLIHLDVDIWGRPRDDHGDGILHIHALAVHEGGDGALPLPVVLLLDRTDLDGAVSGLVFPCVGDPAALIGDVLLEEEVCAIGGGEGAELDGVRWGGAAQLSLVTRPHLYTLLRGLAISWKYGNTIFYLSMLLSAWQKYYAVKITTNARPSD